MKKIFKTEIIDQYLKNNNLSQQEFCLKCEIPLSSLKKILVHNLDFETIHIFKVARFLELHIKELFVKQKTKGKYKKTSH